MSSKLPIALLAKNHDFSNFDCGNIELNRFLQSHARSAASSGSSQTYVALDSNLVVGYFSIATGQLEYASEPERLVKGMPRYPIPAVRLAKLGVDRNHQNRGIGRSLVIEAARKTLEIAALVGVRALVVDAKDQSISNWYEEKFEFTRLTKDGLTLFALVKDLRGY